MDRFRNVFRGFPAGLALLRPDRRIDAVNESLCSLLGFREDELVGRPVGDLVHPEDAEALASRFDAIAAERASSFSLEARLLNFRRQSLRAVLLVTHVPGSGAEPGGYVAQFLDVTAGKIAEARLAQYASELERSNQELEQLAYIISHDLQAPLRTLRGYAELLLEGYGKVLDDQGRRWTTYMITAADRLLAMITDLLKVARVQSHSSPVVLTELRPIVMRAWERIAYLYSGVQSEIICDSLPTVPVDDIQIEQVFQNLFDNALKYRRPDTPPRVEVHHARVGEYWQISVSDNGIGIDMSQADRIFDIFQRLHPDDEYEGTGIGLAVCRKIIERHHGRIWVESEPGRGTTFHFTIPVDAFPEGGER